MARSQQPSLPPLPWLRAFEAAGRRLSFTAAAQELGLTQAAVSQQIRSLEGHLEKVLFHRLRRGVELTPEGAAYLPHVQSAFRALARSTSELFSHRSGHVVALRSPISFAALWLAQRLIRFSECVADVRLEVSTIHVPADYTLGFPNLDIRFGVGPFTGRTAHRLTAERLVPAMAPALAKQVAGDGTAWRDLPLLSVSGAREMWPDWFALAGLPPSPKAAHSFDSFIVAYEAARAGGGVLLASRPLADQAIKVGDLVVLSNLELQSEAGHFVTYPAGVVLTPAEQSVLEWLLREASA